MTVHLLDANVLLALAWPQHVHHGPAHEWFRHTGEKAWATCPITELAFIRISANPKIVAQAVSPREARELLRQIAQLRNHHFWADEVPPVAAETLAGTALAGHRQVTDAYLIALAQHHRGKVATFDRGLAELVTQRDRAQQVTLISA